MELQDRIIKYFEDYYVVRGVDTKGVLQCMQIVDNTVSDFTNIDPLSFNVNKLPIKCISRLIIGGSSLVNILRLIREDISACVAYINEESEILLLCGCKDGNYVVYKLSDEGKSVYICNVIDGEVITPKNRIYTEVIKLTGFSIHFSVNMYKLSDESLGVTCYNILIGLLSNNDYTTSVDLSFLLNIKDNIQYYLMYVKSDEGRDSIMPASQCLEYIESLPQKKVHRDDVISYIQDTYDYPCIHFSEEELEKVSGILENYGYPIKTILKKFNGKVSNFYLKSKNKSIAIFDIPDTKTYEVRVLSCEPIKSYNGSILYYELRSYALGDSSKYDILCTSFKRNIIDSIIKTRLADVIRSSKIHFHGSHCYLEYLKDMKNTLYISCGTTEDSNSFKAKLDKVNKRWYYTVNTPKEVRNFMSRLIHYFNDKYGILSKNMV